MNEVYLGIYRVENDGVLVPVIDERLHDQSIIKELGALGGGVIAAGFGWHRYPMLLEANRDQIDVVGDDYYPRARQLLELGAILLEGGRTVAPAMLDPAYLRQKVAKKPS